MISRPIDFRARRQATARRAEELNRYGALIEHVFLRRHSEGATEIPFVREDLVEAARELGILTPKNLGDVIYSMRYRTPLPDSVLETQPEGKEWTIVGTGTSRYSFKLVRVNRIFPNPTLMAIKIPDATPEIISSYALSDEQALLAKVRYNRLIDVFLGMPTYSLQSHLRTTVREVGQIEIDEIYVGIGRRGQQYVLPVQAKGGADQLAANQIKQDILYCRQKFPDLICRAISTQFMDDNLIALFELTLEHEEPRVVEERHYRLVPSDQISPEDLNSYSLHS